MDRVVIRRTIIINVATASATKYMICPEMYTVHLQPCREKGGPGILSLTLSFSSALVSFDPFRGALNDNDSLLIICTAVLAA